MLLNNEKAKWVEPPEHRPHRGTITVTGPLKEQDDAIFRIARSINCAHFKKVVLNDFLKILVGLPIVSPDDHFGLLVSTAIIVFAVGLTSSILIHRILFAAEIRA